MAFNGNTQHESCSPPIEGNGVGPTYTSGGFAGDINEDSEDYLMMSPDIHHEPFSASASYISSTGSVPSCRADPTVLPIISGTAIPTSINTSNPTNCDTSITLFTGDADAELLADLPKIKSENKCDEIAEQDRVSVTDNPSTTPILHSSLDCARPTPFSPTDGPVLTIREPEAYFEEQYEAPLRVPRGKGFLWNVLKVDRTTMGPGEVSRRNAHNARVHAAKEAQKRRNNGISARKSRDRRLQMIARQAATINEQGVLIGHLEATIASLRLSLEQERYGLRAAQDQLRRLCPILQMALDAGFVPSATAAAPNATLHPFTASMFAPVRDRRGGTHEPIPSMQEP